MYINFRKWLKLSFQTEYPPNGLLTNTQWKNLKKEDAEVEYDELETEIVEERNIDTGIAISDTLCIHLS